MTDRDTLIGQCIDAAESIMQRLGRERRGHGSKLTTDALGDIRRTLGDLEDRLYGQGEYAPENVAQTGKPSFSRGK